MIDDRPKIVDKRERIWDWEWDTIIWKRWWSKQVILTNVERKTWYLIARKIKDKSWESVLEWTIQSFKKIPKYKQKTMTYDNWREFSEHKMIEYFTNFNIYFAHPYCSWERWTNENTNWLLRQFFPKKTDFENFSQNQLQYFVSMINSRPRKRLNYKTPYEVFFDKNLKLCSFC
jgi:IS30 family transposase